MAGNGYGGGADPDGGITFNSSDGSGTVVLAGNQLIGGLTINGGVVRMGASSSLNNLEPVNILTFGSSSTERLQLNGFNGFVGGLISSSTNAVVENGNGSNSNVVFGVVEGDDETYAGTLVNTVSTGTGTLGFLKGGAGTLSLTNGGSTYTGITEIDGGTLNVASLSDIGNSSSIGKGIATSDATNAASLVFGGGATQADGFTDGTLQYTGSTAQTTNRLFTLGDVGNSVLGTGGVAGNNGTIDASGTGTGSVTFSNTHAIAFANVGVHNLTLTGSNAGANTFAPLIGDSTVGSGYATSVTKSGVGAWAVTNANIYSGGTSIKGGTFYANNASGSATGSGNVSVAGGTLSGTGAINPTVHSAVTVASNGTLAPGVNSIAGSGVAAPTGTQGIVPFIGSPGTLANGNLTLNTTEFTGGAAQYATFNGAAGTSGNASTTPLLQLNSANLTFSPRRRHDHRGQQHDRIPGKHDRQQVGHRWHDRQCGRLHGREHDHDQRSGRSRADAQPGIHSYSGATASRRMTREPAAAWWYPRRSRRASATRSRVVSRSWARTPGISIPSGMLTAGCTSTATTSMSRSFPSRAHGRSCWVASPGCCFICAVSVRTRRISSRRNYESMFSSGRGDNQYALACPVPRAEFGIFA